MHNKKYRNSTPEALEAIRRNPPRIMDIAEVSIYLGQSPRKTRNDVRLGRLPRIKLGGSVRFRIEDVDRALARLSA